MFHFQIFKDFPDTFLVLIFTLIPLWLKNKRKITNSDFNPLKFIKIYFMTKYSVYFGEHSMCIWVAYVSYRFRISGFPDSSVGKQSACNADPSSIPGSGRSPGEGIGYPLQYSRASLVTQLVKNWPAMWETWVWFLGWEDPLDKGKATHSSILAWRIPWTG